MAIFLVSFFFLWVSSYGQDYNCSSPPSVIYDYNYSSPLGPDNWASLYPVECGENRQSPINVDTSSDITYLENEEGCVSGYFLDFNLSHKGFKLSNSGHGFKLAPIDESGNYLQSNDNVIAKLKNVVYDEHAQYCFDSVHFHYGPNVSHGSEHHLDGEQYPIEAHFVFYSCNYDNIGDAICAHNTEYDNDTEILAVLGVFFEVGDSNSAYSDITPHIDDIIWPGNSTTIDVDFSGFFGGESELNDIIESIYMYEGSLTTPSCFKAVLWHVSSRVLKISQSQLNTLYTLRQNDANYNTLSTFGNYRPLQPRGSRKLWKLDCESKAICLNLTNIVSFLSFYIFIAFFVM